jgi:hypothetical protein
MRARMWGAGERGTKGGSRRGSRRSWLIGAPAGMAGAAGAAGLAACGAGGGQPEG